MKKVESIILDLKQIDKFEPSIRPDRFARYINSIFRQFEEVEDEYVTEQEAKNYVKNNYFRILESFLEYWTPF